MPDEAEKRQFTVLLPPDTKERLERCAAYFYHHPITRIVELLGPALERGVLERLRPQQKKAYLLGELSAEQAFGRNRFKERAEKLKGKRRPAQARIALSVIISDDSREALLRYAKFWAISAATILHRHSLTMEKHILKGLSPEDQQQFLAGKLQRNPQIPVDTSDAVLNGEDNE